MASSGSTTAASFWRPVVAFRTKLLLALLLLTAGLTITLMLLVWRDIRRLPTDVTRAIVEVKLAQAVRNLDRLAGDIEGLSRDFARDSDAYRRVHEELVAIARPGEDPDGFGHSMQFDVYLLDRPAGSKGRLLVTLEPEESGREYDMSRFASMATGWEKLVVESEPSADEYGHTLSGYAPVKNASGRTVAMLGIDAPEAGIKVSRNRLLVITGVGAFVAFLGSGICAVLMSRLLYRPVELLHSGMTRVAAGDFAVKLDPIERIGGEDEFSSLIPQFNRMVEGLQDRELLKKNLELAAQIQGHLLPTVAPVRAGFDMYGGADYCDETGGDYFDFLEFSPVSETSPVGLVVADVAGHGIASALVMTGARSALRVSASYAGGGPAELLRTINEHLCRDGQVQKFVTLFYGILDPAASTLVWSSAGHERGQLIRGATGVVEELETTGTPLSVLDGEVYPLAGPVRLEAGDILLIPTDGIREARNAAGEFFEIRRMVEVALARRDRPAREIHAAVLAAVHAFRGGDVPQQDDITLVVVKRS